MYEPAFVATLPSTVSTNVPFATNSAYAAGVTNATDFSVPSYVNGPLFVHAHAVKSTTAGVITTDTVSVTLVTS